MGTKKISDILDIEIFNKAILNVISEGVDVVDENLNIVWMNDKFTSTFGSESIGKKCFELYKDNKKQCNNCPIKNLSNIDVVKTNIVEGICGGRTYAINHAPLILKNGSRAVLEVFRDVSGVVKQKKELEEKSAEIDSLSRNSYK